MWSIVATPLALIVIGIVARLFIADHGQCDRRCRALFGNASLGTRDWPHADQCHCDISGAPSRSVARSNPLAPPTPPGSLVCGADHRTYHDARDASAHTTVLHAGTCGACSNTADIDAYRRTATTLTSTAEGCAFRTLMFGAGVGRACLHDAVGLTPSCTDCWVDNMRCTAVHCLGVCLNAKLHGTPPNGPDGALNPCLACDEAYCGDPFIRCAGANRRRAGIVSDIARPAPQVWSGGH